MVSISAEQVFSSTFQLSNTEQVQSANNKVTSSLARVGKSWNNLKGNLEQGQAALAAFGGREGIIAAGGFLLGSQALGESAGDTFLGQAGVLIGSLAVYNGVYSSLNRYVANSNKVFRRQILDATRGIRRADSEMLLMRKTLNKQISSGEVLINNAKRAYHNVRLTVASARTLVNSIGPFVVSAVAAAFGGQLIGNLLDNLSAQLSRDIESGFTSFGQKISTGIDSLAVLGADITLFLTKTFVPFGSLIADQLGSVITILQPTVTSENKILRNLTNQQEFLSTIEEELKDVFSNQEQIDRELNTIKNKLNELTKQYNDQMSAVVIAQAQRGRR